MRLNGKEQIVKRFLGVGRRRVLYIGPTLSDGDRAESYVEWVLRGLK